MGKKVGRLCVNGKEALCFADNALKKVSSCRNNAPEDEANTTVQDTMG